MAIPNVTFLYNHSLNDVVNSGGASGDGNWEVLDSVNDKISFQGTGTNDGDPNTSKSVFVIPESSSKEIPDQFINDYSESEWAKVYLGGSDANQGGGGNNRYVYGVYIDGETSSAPALQAWDDDDHASYDLEVLGSGTPASSMVRAIATTNGAPGSEWAGTPLAGAGVSNSILLDIAALSGAKMLYWNMRLLIPYTANPLATFPVLSVYFMYS